MWERDGTGARTANESVARSLQPVSVLVAEIAGQRPSVPLDARAFFHLGHHGLAAIFNAEIDGAGISAGSSGRIERLTCLEAEGFETRERRNLLVPIDLLGEGRIVEDEADPSQKFNAAEFSGSFTASMPG